MSLTSALTSAVSGLTAQSLALSAISENIANASTTAYKTKDVSFQSLVTGAGSGGNSVSGVSGSTSQSVSVQGLVEATDVSTNIAIQGSGYFVVADDTDAKASDYKYTRNGSFSTDADGYLVNEEGYYLLGFATDAEGNITTSNTSDLSGLQPISVESISGTAKATTEVSMVANLPADAAAGDTFTTSIEILDSVGVSHTIEQTWTKDSANSWTLTLSNPYSGDDASTSSGTISPSTVTVTFDQNGLLASTNPSPIDLTITGLSSGAGDTRFTLDLGTAGSADGLTQFASTVDTPAIEVTEIEQDGARYGQLTSVSIDDDGLVTANFDNGLSMAIYQIPVATFSNPAGLTLVEGTVYDESLAAGSLNISLPGQGGAGSLEASALEASTTDTAVEFNKMIVAQQAYSAAAQLISTVDDMFESLIQAVR
ncbi:flagellar hook protein FlgE [Parapedomonas caeni]